MDDFLDEEALQELLSDLTDFDNDSGGTHKCNSSGIVVVEEDDSNSTITTSSWFQLIPPDQSYSFVNKDNQLTTTLNQITSTAQLIIESITEQYVIQGSLLFQVNNQFTDEFFVQFPTLTSFEDHRKFINDVIKVKLELLYNISSSADRDEKRSKIIEKCNRKKLKLLSDIKNLYLDQNERKVDGRSKKLKC